MLISSGISIVQLTCAFCFAAIRRLDDFFCPSAKILTVSMLMASRNSICVRTSISLSVKLTTLAVNTNWSPCRTKRGTFGRTINSFCAFIFLTSVPVFKSLEVASIINFHSVRASGVVKVSSIFPLLSVLSSG